MQIKQITTTQDQRKMYNRGNTQFQNYPPNVYGSPVPPGNQYHPGLPYQGPNRNYPTEYPAYPAYPSNSYGSPVPPGVQYQRPQFQQIPYNSNLKQIFDAWDTNKSGSIDQGELASALGQMGEQNDFETVSEMIKAYDTDGSGTISFNEFADLHNYIQNLRTGFNTQSSDRGIGFEEAKNILGSMHGTSLIAAPAMLYSIWKVYDRTGNGKVSYRDFIIIAFCLKTLLKNYNKTQ